MTETDVQGQALEMVETDSLAATGTPEFLTVAEAARVLRVDRSTLSEAIRRGEVEVTKVGKRILVPRDSLQPKPKPPEFDTIIAEQFNYYNILRQLNNLEDARARSEAFLALHCPDGEWKKIAKRVPRC